MSTIPVRRKRLLGLPPWVLPLLIAVVLATGWMFLADDDLPATDVIEAGADNPPVIDPSVTTVALPAPPPPGAPLPSASGSGPTAGMTAVEGSAGEPVDAATQAAVRAEQTARAAARASRDALASVAAIGQTIRASASSAGALSGRAVQLSNVRVAQVLSDRAFLVGSGSDRILVIMDPTGGDAPVRAGEIVSITGALESYSAGPSETGLMRDAGQSGYAIATRPGGISR